MTKKYRQYSISVNADVDVQMDDITDALTDEDVMEMVETRGLTLPPPFSLEDLRSAILMRDWVGALALVERWAEAKPNNDASLRDKYERAKAHRDPQTDQPVIQ